MNEFLKLKWNFKGDYTYLEQQACTFVPDEVLLESYVYKHLKKPLPQIKKTTTQKNAIVFFPGRMHTLKVNKKSMFTKQQQEHILEAMKLLRLNKNPSLLKQKEAYSLEIFNKLSPKITRENCEFIDFVKKSWEFNRDFMAKLENNLYRYAFKGYQNKTERYLKYGDFYKEEKLLSLVYNEDNSVAIDVNHIKNLLELGTLARFSCPSLKIECRLGAKTLPELSSNIQTNSRLPVSQDENVRKLIQNNDIDIVISSSGLKKLLDNADFKTKWTIPVSIENVKDGKKVVFIDKPLVDSHVDPLDLKYFSMKRLVKTNFCQYEAFRYEQPDIPIENSEEIVENKEENEEQEVEKKGKKRPLEKSTIHHNAVYRLWQFKKTVNNCTLMKNTGKNALLNVLIRSKLDGCELVSPSEVLQPVIVRPKIELQLEFGANVATKSELCREWTSLFFAPFSVLYRVRMHWKTAEVISIEKCNLSKINNEAQALYEFNPYIGLGVLNNLFNNLTELETGNYLLSHLPKNESFVSVLKQCDSATSTMQLNGEYKKCLVDVEFKRNWVPIDLNYILPIHEHEKRPPGFFKPFEKRGWAGKGKKKQKKGAGAGAGKKAEEKKQ